ncbi:MAG: WhiB family transcriptional regulator [Pseudonocardiaceae bacterium]
MTEWIDRAACRRFDPELFFPIGSGTASTRQAARAKAVCGCCPVSEECLILALRSGEVDGIWGGLDASERRSLMAVRLAHDHVASSMHGM